MTDKKEQKLKIVERPVQAFQQSYIHETDDEGKACGGEFVSTGAAKLMSNPPQHQLVCNKCGTMIYLQQTPSVVYKEVPQGD